MEEQESKSINLVLAIYLPEKSGYSSNMILSNGLLKISDSNIELSIYFDKESLTIPEHISLINDWSKYNLDSRIIVCEGEYSGQPINIDLSSSARIKLSNSSSFHPEFNHVTKLGYDKIKLISDNFNELPKNTAYLHLNPNGFHFIKHFYNLISIKTGNLVDLSKRKNSKFKIKNGYFIPQFYLRLIDGSEKRAATIIKKPMIGLFLNKNILYEDVERYEDVILGICSFFHQVKYSFPIKEHIYFDHIEATYTAENLELETQPIHMLQLGVNFRFTEFLEKVKIDLIWENYKILKKAINLYVQAGFLTETTEFLVRYNILEILASYIYKSLKENIKAEIIFPFTGDLDTIKKKFAECLNIFLNILPNDHHSQFEKTWQYFKDDVLESKKITLTEKLELLLDQCDIDIKKLPISVNKIVRLRNDITHGSVDSKSLVDITKYNNVLYQLNGLVILRFMGLRSKLYTFETKENIL